MEKEDKYNLYLEKIENISKKDSALDEKIKNAAGNKEIKKYLEYLRELETLSEKQKYYEKRESILEKINKDAFEWYEKLKDGKIEEIEDIYEVWKWKQLSQEFEKLEKEP